MRACMHGWSVEPKGGGEGYVRIRDDQSASLTCLYTAVFMLNERCGTGLWPSSPNRQCRHEPLCSFWQMKACPRHDHRLQTSSTLPQP